MSDPVAHLRQTHVPAHSLPMNRVASVDLAVQLTALRVEQLRYRATGGTENTNVLLVEALRALEYAHAELAAARDELHEHADQMFTTRLERELEWTRYRDLFEAAPVPYLETDAQGIVIESNRACCELLNVASAQLIGKPLIVFVALSDRLNFRRTLDALIGRSKRACMSVGLRPRGTGAEIPARTEISTVGASHVKAPAVRWMFIRTLTAATDEPSELGGPDANGAVLASVALARSRCQRQSPRLRRCTPIGMRSRAKR